jgi:septum formation protein
MSPQIILASRSPRRRELLEQAGVQYQLDFADIDESSIVGEIAEDYTIRMACEKAAAVASRRQNDLPVLGADTAVIVDGVILGKPDDHEHARQLLGIISGRVHQVYSAVALIDSSATVRHRLNISNVEFDILDSEWIERYLATGDSMDKAGAYGVQGLAASRIRHLDGSYSGVMGLPLYETMQLLGALEKQK